MAVPLAELLAEVQPRESRGALDVPISGVSYDSRQVRAGHLFAALPGSVVDGKRFIDAALERGAVAILCAPPLPDELPATVSAVGVDDPRAALGVVAAAFHGHPTRTLELVGVTGTNGKTTVTFILESIGRAAGRKVGVTGTITYRFAGREQPAAVTTPESADLQALFAEMQAAGVDLIASEVSSHALIQHRVSGVDFAVAAFLNLSQDHLDYHGDLEAYAAAKELLFNEYLPRSRGPRGPVAVFCVDTATGARFAARHPGPKLTCASRVGVDADVVPARAEFSLDGIRADLVTPQGPLTLRSALLGQANLQNLVTAVTAALALELPLPAIAAGVAALPTVPGRWDRVGEGAAGPAVVVDYAHTPDAIDHALATLRPLTAGRLIVVVGCGGDRDRDKRPKMGAAAARGGDLVIVTSDNPRTEDPAAIIEQILPGLVDLGVPRRSSTELGAVVGTGEMAAAFAVESDRRAAIRAAITGAHADDVVAILGKGHEDYQILGTEKTHFDDREEAVDALGRWEAPR